MDKCSVGRILDIKKRPNFLPDLDIKRKTYIDLEKQSNGTMKDKDKLDRKRQNWNDVQTFD